MRFAGGNALTVASPIRSVPDVTSSRPAIILKRVDFFTPGWSHQNEELTVLDLQVDAVHDLVVAIAFSELVEPDLRHRTFLPAALRKSHCLSIMIMLIIKLLKRQRLGFTTKCRGSSGHGEIWFRPARSGEVFDALKREIMLGELAVGEPLVELELAARFGCSQGPVREALLQPTGGGPRHAAGTSRHPGCGLHRR